MQGNDPEFDKVIGSLDFVLSKLMGYAKDAKAGTLSEPNRQTLKHHAEDMVAAGNAILKRLGKLQEGTPQPKGFKPPVMHKLEGGEIGQLCENGNGYTFACPECGKFDRCPNCGYEGSDDG